MPVSTVISAQQTGMTAALHAAVIPETSYARGINISVRGGYVRTRPGFHMISSEVAAALVPETSLFQGAAAWRTANGLYIATVFSGIVRLTNFDTGATTEVGAYLDPTGMVYIVQAGSYLVFHGGGTSFLALDWTGGTWAIKKTPLLPTSLLDNAWDRRMQGISLADDVAARMEAEASLSYDDALTAAMAALTAPSYPPGTVCCFAHGRIHLSSEALGHRYFYSSDYTLPSDPASVLRWWENSFLNGGGGLGLPDEMGEIRGMAVVKNSDDVASGIGPLIVLAQDGAAAFSVHLPREGVFDVGTGSSGAVPGTAKLLQPGWKDQKIGQVLFYGGGTESPWSLARVNGDLVYRSQDGLRTIGATTSASSGSIVANAPISTEIAPFIAMDAGAAALDRVSAASCDNRLLVTASRNGAAGHRGLISLDLCVLASLGQQGLRAYDGMWTGFDTAMILSAGSVFVIVATDGRIYKLTDSPWDMVDGVRRNIECQWITRMTDFGHPGIKKRLEFVDLWLRDMQGEITVSVYYRPDNFAWWTPMDGVYDFNLPDDLPPQERRRLRFRVASTNLGTYDGSLVTQGDTFQFLVIWRGVATVQRLSAIAHAETETPPRSTEGCDFSALEAGEGQILQNDFSYPGGN